MDSHFRHVTKLTNLEISLRSHLHLQGQTLYFLSRVFWPILQAFCEILMRLNKVEIWRKKSKIFSYIVTFYFNREQAVFIVGINFSWYLATFEYHFILFLWQILGFWWASKLSIDFSISHTFCSFYCASHVTQAWKYSHSKEHHWFY